MIRHLNQALGAFLRTHRARLEPWDVGLPHDDGRRVPGLRREEVARLAGMSPDYYTRLEQGRRQTASSAVLDGLARALRLTADERLHLYALAAAPVTEDVGPLVSRTLTPGTHRVIELLGDTPVMVCGPFIDVVSANPAAAFLFADFNTMPASERNGLRWMLLSPTARERYGDSWAEAAAEMTGMLRLEQGRAPNDPRLARLVTELAELSPLFRRQWHDLQVSRWVRARKTLYHPAFGTMGFHNEFMTLQSVPGQTLVVMMPEDPGAFRAALRPPAASGRTGDTEPAPS
ncbi:MULTISPECIES: helix-turn-helix transcriptional regulator [Streptomyces]|uniref:helix-turn-helix transcriptional regulator n=1 Tax=Streptomyces TaxID=1883 RepID=UPI00240E2D87|nr:MULTISPECIES: helix-turn-helix transcriptional regulator [Streptomyces]WFB88517.1 helix-turn-helix transcriptional regulator [Streptomyces olivaceus]WGK50659.1 helix-turn-helix transcriptional regulator [Streptomyces sp. B146]